MPGYKRTRSDSSSNNFSHSKKAKQSSRARSDSCLKNVLAADKTKLPSPEGHKALSLKSCKTQLPGVPEPKQMSELATIESLSHRKMKRIVESTTMWAYHVMETMPVFKAEVTLEDLSHRSKDVTCEIKAKVKKMEALDPQVVTGCWVDSNNEVLAVYYSQGPRPKPSKMQGNDENDASVQKSKSLHKNHNHPKNGGESEEPAERVKNLTPTPVKQHKSGKKNKSPQKKPTRAQQRGKEGEFMERTGSPTPKNKSHKILTGGQQKREEGEFSERMGLETPLALLTPLEQHRDGPKRLSHKQRTAVQQWRGKVEGGIRIPTLMVPQPLSQQYVNRTLKSIKDGPESLHRHGLNQADLRLVEKASQFLASKLPPRYDPKDARHIDNSPLVQYTIAPDIQDYNCAELEVNEQSAVLERANITGAVREEGVNEEDEEDGEEKSQESINERTGVTHLVQCWYPLGHKKRMVPSADLVRTCQGSMAAHTYYRATQKVSCHLAGLFKAAFPLYYQKYKKAFEAGVWVDEDTGPWIGRAIVWKLQVGIHRDGLDEGPAACFPCGSYEGGELCLPDLDAKLKYDPGDVIIFMAGALFHSVTPWKPAQMKETDVCTPGRIGHVFFFPEKSYKTLEGKKKGWSKHHCGGLIPESD